jgi:hypothetical protein
MPGDERRLARRPRPRHPPRRGTTSVGRIDEVVVGVAGAGQPDAAVEHFELAARGAERQDAAALEQLEVSRGAALKRTIRVAYSSSISNFPMPVMIVILPVEIQ